MKKSIRKEMLKRREMLAESDWLEKSAAIQKKLMGEEFYKKASVILLYCHFGKEVRTDLIISDALKKGKEVLLPFNDWRKNTFVPARIYSENDINRRKKIPEPFMPDAFPPDRPIHLAVIPGVAFDLFGSRIGMGRGFFDRFLGGKVKVTAKVALAFDFQVTEKLLPADEWDSKADVIVTETRIIKTAASKHI